MSGCLYHFSNDFHSTFERIYRSMDLFPHEDWRVSSNVTLTMVRDRTRAVLNLWFKKYLGDEQIVIPETPPSDFNKQWGCHLFVSPKEIDRLGGLKSTTATTRIPVPVSGTTWRLKSQTIPGQPRYQCTPNSPYLDIAPT